MLPPFYKFQVGGDDKWEGQNFDSWPPKPNTIHKNKPFWDGALGDRTVDLYNSLFVVGMALRWLLIYQSFNYILQRYPPDTSRHHPDNLPNFSKNPGSSWEDTAEDWCHYLGLCRSSLWPRLWLDTHSQPLNTPRHPLDIIQTPRRHHSATLHQVFGWSSGRKDCRLI